MKNPRTFLIAISAFLIIFYLIYKEIKKIGMQESINNQQNQQIEVQNEIIETKSFQQRIISKNPASDSATDRVKWLHNVWQKKAAYRN